ncbi:MAG: hypothetical protein R2791_14215 [Saprospiraceae bacterium]
MKRYLAQLLADLETAARGAPEPSSYASFRAPVHDDEQHREDLHTRYVRLSELFGLPSHAFPPVERLTKPQVGDLLTAIERLWRAWRISWDCPARLTARRRYALMVDWMYHQKVLYHHDFGAEIDFCCDRAIGICPFGDQAQCYCQELEDAARHDVDIWEEYHQGQQGIQSTPVEEFYEWLHRDNPDEYEWDFDEARDRWRQFTADDSDEWLYFYRPDVGATLQGDDPEPQPGDFDDFDWDDSGHYDDDITLPF